MENSFREYERFQVSKEHNYCLAHHIWQCHSWQINHESVEYKKINIENSMNLCSYSWFLQCSVGMHLRVTSPLCCKVYKFPFKTKISFKIQQWVFVQIKFGSRKEEKNTFSFISPLFCLRTWVFIKLPHLFSFHFLGVS